MAIVFLNSKVFGGKVGITGDVVELFRKNEDLREALNDFYRRDQSQDEESASGATTVQANFHKTLADVIAKNRSLFPPEAFSIETRLPSTPPVKTAIPAAAGGITPASTSAANALALLLGTAGGESGAGESGATAGIATVARAYAGAAA
ncbi:hypothetical protein [Xanthobacter sediminis]